VRCERAARHLPAAAEGASALPADVAAHVERCLRCQVEVLRYRRIARAMRQLGQQSAAPASGLALDVASLIQAAGGDAESRLSRHRRTAYLAAATAAGAAGALVIASRSRRGRLGLAG
jgi:ATP phosphoribosyltransferase regulatory subunit HisZ